MTSEDGSNIAIYRDADSNQAADAEALAKARAEAKDELKAALLTAIADEAEDESVTLPEDVMADATTFTHSSIPGLTVKNLLDNYWYPVIDRETTTEDVATELARLKAQVDVVATAYVAALKTAAETAADAALTAIKTALNGKTASTATVTDPSAFKAAVDAAVEALVTDPKATVTVVDYGDLTTKTASLNGSGHVIVTGVEIQLTYEGASAPQNQNLGDITVYYQGF